MVARHAIETNERSSIIRSFTEKMEALMFTPEQVASLLIQAYKYSVGTVHRLSTILDGMVEWVYTLKQYEGVTPEKITEIILGEFPVETSVIVLDEAMQAENRLHRLKDDLTKLFSADPESKPIMVYSTEGPVIYPRKAYAPGLSPEKPRLNGSRVAKFIPNPPKQ